MVDIEPTRDGCLCLNLYAPFRANPMVEEPVQRQQEQIDQTRFPRDPIAEAEYCNSVYARGPITVYDLAEFATRIQRVGTSQILFEDHKAVPLQVPANVLVEG